MNITKKQFDLVLNSIEVTSSSERIYLQSYNENHYVDITYNISKDEFQDFTFFLQENEVELSEEQEKSISKLIDEKIEEQEQSIRDAQEIKDTQDFIDYNFHKM